MCVHLLKWGELKNYIKTKTSTYECTLYLHDSQRDLTEVSVSACTYSQVGTVLSNWECKLSVISANWSNFKLILV